MSIPTPDVSYDRRHFTFDKLERILAIGQTHRIEAMDFTLLSIECYQSGFSATILLEQDWQAPDPTSGPEGFEPPQMLQGVLLVSEVVDDLGNRYLGQMGPGGGGDRDGRLSSHIVYNFAPSLHPAARRLTLTLAQVERPRYDAEHRPYWHDDQVLGGPWTLSFPLEPVPQNEPAPVSVLPVGQQLSRDDVRVAIHTIERYPTSFFVSFRLDWTGPGDGAPFLACYASDDRGETYGCGNCSGGGLGLYGNPRLIRPIFRIPFIGQRLVRAFERRRRSQSSRLHCQFEPALSPDAGELTLEFRSLRLNRTVIDEDEQMFNRWESLRELPNLGAVAIPLSITHESRGT